MLHLLGEHIVDSTDLLWGVAGQVEAVLPGAAPLALVWGGQVAHQHGPAVVAVAAHQVKTYQAVAPLVAGQAAVDPLLVAAAEVESAAAGRASDLVA